MGKRGQGYQKAGEITKLGEPRVIILKAMRTGRTGLNGNLMGTIDSEENAESTRGITYLSNQIRLVRGLRSWQEHGVGGRMSELLGLKLVEMIHGTVQEEEPGTKIYYTKPAPKWYLTELGKNCPLDPDWDPSSKSDTIKEALDIGRFWK